MFEKILVPLDGSELAAKILPSVVELAKKFNSQVTLIHVCHTEGFGTGEAAEVAKAVPAEGKKVCETFLSKAGKDLQAQGVNVTWTCVEGVPAREIVGYAHKNKMDLICMTTHGRSEVGWVLGSTAERVVTHSNVPVMLTRVMVFRPPAHLDEEYWVP
jgi:nucleotide-binding universal stress UspA family protein|uniref:Universal stress protein n=1 Tax=Desulfobacca acetoxidans TaxID=60893 RepID=A0A7V6A404_9BACT